MFRNSKYIYFFYRNKVLYFKIITIFRLLGFIK